MSAPKDLLRFITCGSVDDGKSTLIGRLLHDAGAVPEDQVAALKNDDGNLDYSLLVDGLLAEREQGITIDVAYRYFSTPKRQFIVADTPGHEQYTRNMATGASTADAAVVLIDARKGVLTQTRRHSHIVSLLGVRHVILAVTKMDMVGWSKGVFDAIAAEYTAYAAEAGLPSPILIPVSGKEGDNLVTRGGHSDWYTGPTLIEVLEGLPVGQEVGGPFRMAVQGINRPNLDFRGYMGRINAGVVKVGDEVVVVPSGVRSRIERIVSMDGDLAQAVAGQSVTLTLTDEIDIARGDILCAAQAPVEAADQFEATLIWMSQAPLIPGRLYDLKIGARTVPAQVTDIRHRVNVNTQEKLSARTLDLNDIGVCHLSLGKDVGFEAYEANRELGGFILIDRISRATVGAGLIHFALRRAHNIHRQAIKVDREQRAALKGQKPLVVWFTGLSGSGKSTIANRVEELLASEGRHTYLIDGDNLRHGLTRDLGFTEADRVENIRRATEVAAMMADAGLIVLVSLISPYQADRDMARTKAGHENFLEVFVDAPLDVLEARDPKGLYAKARSGRIKNFTGIDSPYEPPHSPDLHLCTSVLSLEQSAQKVLLAIQAATSSDRSNRK